MSEHMEFMPIDHEEQRPPPKSMLYNEITSNLADLTESVNEIMIENTEIIDEIVAVEQSAIELASVEKLAVEEKITDIVNTIEQSAIELVSVEKLAVEEKITDIVKTMVEKQSLVIILRKTINQKYIGLENYSIQITPEMKTILTKLLNDTAYFDEVEQCLKDIVQDDKIDSNDVPKILILISNLYKKLHGLKIKFNEKLCGDILKFIFDIAIKEGIVKINNKNIELMKCVYSIIDTSISLMLTKKELTSKKGIFNCILKVLL